MSGVRIFSNHDAGSMVQKMIHTIIPNAAQKQAIRAPITKGGAGADQLKAVDDELAENLNWLKTKQDLDPEKQQRMAEMMRRDAERRKGDLGGSGSEGNPGLLRKIGRYYAGREGDDVVLSHAAARIGATGAAGAGLYYGAGAISGLTLEDE